MSLFGPKKSWLKPTGGPTHKDIRFLMRMQALRELIKFNSRGLTGFPKNVGQKPPNYSTNYHTLSP